MPGAKYYEWEAKQIEEYGWYAHYVFDEDSATQTNIHTHGLPDKYGHMDLQIVIPLPKNVAQGILWAVVRRIESGDVFKAGDMADEIVHEFKVKFVGAIECGRPVLRIILPDKYGGLDQGDFKDEKFGLQYEGTIKQSA